MRISIWSRILTMLILILVVSLSSGYYVYAKLMPEPIIEYIEIEVVREVPVPYVVTQTRYVSYPVQVPVVKEVKVWLELRHFDNITELKEWLAEDNVNLLKASYPNFDCDDYAYKLQQHAMKDGYIISTELVGSGYHRHMLNSALIDGKIYFIEPQTDKVWFKCDRD